MNPYSKSTDTDDIICDVRTIRQSLIVGEDTCYGVSQIDHMWRDKKNGEQFELNKKKYHRYSGSLQQFFPDGAIDVVDKISELERANRDEKLWMIALLSAIASMISALAAWYAVMK